MTMKNGSSFARPAHQSIQPIETLWKGYRFRSRLEARWAVFFETLGLNWEYESQGFELPDGSRYLPDFYLPDQGTHVEIKPRIDRQFEKVYLAGKFSTDWRDEIVDGHSSCTWEIDHKRGDFHFNICVGPFRVNHGERCHGIQLQEIVPCTHGAFGDKQDRFESPPGSWWIENGYSTINFSFDTGYSAEQVKEQCLDAIHRCTVFFAWIDSLDCYGTIAEIGYAKALGKKVFIGIDSKLEIPSAGIIDCVKSHNIDYQDDLWFVKSMSSRWMAAKTPKLAYEKLLNTPFHEIEKISQLPDWLLISGNPHPGEYIAISSKSGYGSFMGKLMIGQKKSLRSLRLGSEDKEIVHALSVARAARFEHGEKP